MADTAFRPAAADDLAAIEAVVEAAYRPWVEVIGAVPGPLEDDYAVPLHAGQITVAERDERVVGFAILVPMGDNLRVENIAVAPDAQGEGLGRAFLDHAEATARADRMMALELYTHARMDRNIRLYKEAGFVVSHKARERGLDRVYMRKVLV